jgi:hypothetical protein
MSSSQLKDLTVEELLHYAQANAQEAEERARATTRRATNAETARARTKATCLRCAEEAVEAAMVADSALAELEELETTYEIADAAAAVEVVEAVAAVEAAKEAMTKRAETLAYFDIAHKERMLGEWPVEIQKEAVEAVKQKLIDRFDTGILEYGDEAGKLSKRRIRKTKMKTKRRRQKITKTKRRRQKITKRRRK